MQNFILATSEWIYLGLPRSLHASRFSRLFLESHSFRLAAQENISRSPPQRIVGCSLIKPHQVEPLRACHNKQSLVDRPPQKRASRAHLKNDFFLAACSQFLPRLPTIELSGIVRTFTSVVAGTPIDVAHSRRPPSCLTDVRSATAAQSYALLAIEEFLGS